MATRNDYQLVTHPEKAPAVDFFTRSGNGPFVDTGVDVILRSRPGMPVVTERVYLSRDTIRNLAQVAGVLEEGGVSAAREAQLIAQGKLEGMRENLGGDALVDLARTLSLTADAAGLSGHRTPRS
jgi:hypothetical protein